MNLLPTGVVRCMLCVVLLTACEDDSQRQAHPDEGEVDGADLADAECEGEAEEWIADFAADAEGEATPEQALEQAQEEAASPLPSGEPHRVAATDDHVEYGFTDGPTYTGSATVRHLNSTWLVESAIVCR